MTFDTHSQLRPNKTALCIPASSWCKYFPSLFRATGLAFLGFLVVIWHFRGPWQDAIAFRCPEHA